MAFYCPILSASGEARQCMGKHCMWWRDTDCIVSSIGDALQLISLAVDED